MNDTESTHPEDRDPYVEVEDSYEAAIQHQQETDSHESPNLKISIPGYKILKELSMGGQAVVLLALQKTTGRKVAIKFLRETPFGSSREKSRLEREVSILAALDHPNIVSVVDRGETFEGSSYFVLEYINGQIFSEFLDEFRQRHPPIEVPLELDGLLRLFIRVCEAINAAHLRGIVHRDIKPSNIIIDHHGEPHILDFGLARSSLPRMDEEDGTPQITMSGEFLGSLQWASPEQAEGAMSKIDTRSDVYSLGVILYELLTVDFPYDVFTGIREVLDNIVTAKPRPPSEIVQEKIIELAKESGQPIKTFKNPVGPDLDAIVLKALEKSQANRYQSAGEFAKDLSNYVSQKPLENGGNNVSRRRSIWPLALAGIVALLTAGLVAYMMSLTGTSKNSQAGTQGGINSVMASPQQAAGVVGYTISDENVMFEFNPADFRTVRLANGQLGDLSSVRRIGSVSIAGGFNEWVKDLPDWSMQRASDGTFILSKPLSVFAGNYAWPFKFVVNGEVWVGAPETALNREVVVEDTATYNLVLENPSEQPEESVLAAKKYRERIEAVWPGQGSNIAMDDAEQYHFSLASMPGSDGVSNLGPLRDIPLTSINLGDAVVTDFSPLKNMKTLEKIVISDQNFLTLMGLYIESIHAGQYENAEKQVQRYLSPLKEVPAFDRLDAALRNTIKTHTELAAGENATPSSALAFEGRHYAMILLPMTWGEAESYASSAGGHLATIRSAEHMQWMIDQFGLPSAGRQLWLGGHDVVVEGRWLWVNGDAWDYHNWDANEPNNEQGSQNHLAMKADGWWIDFDGNTTRLPFIIEWK